MNQPEQNYLAKDQRITNILLRNSSFIDNVGLMNGKMGISIFFFHLAQNTGNITYEDYASELIDDIYQKIGSSAIPLNFENGLAGIAWGIEHLVQHSFLEADTDDILADLDDKIFLHLTTTTEFPIGLNKGLLGYGVYLLSRLRNKNMEKASGRNLLLKWLMIDLINRLYTAIEEKEESLLEPVCFNVTWPLPLTLILLAETNRLNIWNRKVNILLKRLSGITLGSFPVKHSNRLFLRIAMEAVSNQIDIAGWNEHIRLLKNNTSMDQILQEFPDKGIMVNDGLGGVSLITQLFYSNSKKNEITQVLAKIAKKIAKSTFWESFEEIDKLRPKDAGLLYGLAGVGYLLFGIPGQDPTQNEENYIRKEKLNNI